MAQAVKCPVCGGSGKISIKTSDKTIKNWDEVCYGCGGRGWVEVGNDCPVTWPPSANPWSPHYPFVTWTYF